MYWYKWQGNRFQEKFATQDYNLIMNRQGLSMASLALPKDILFDSVFENPRFSRTRSGLEVCVSGISRYFKTYLGMNTENVFNQKIHIHFVLLALYK